MAFGLGGSAQLGIGIAVMLQDQFSAKAKQVSASMRAMRDSAHQEAMQAMRDYQTRATAISAGAAAMTYGMIKMAEQGAKFEQVIQKSAIVAEGRLGKGKLKQMALDMSETFRMDPSKIAMGLFENVKAGVTDNIELITKYQLAVAKATDETLEGETGVAKGLLNITNAMGLSYGEFPRVANAVTVAANQTQASVESLNEAMKYTANTASKAGYGLEPTLAALGMLSQMGIEGSSAGTALSNLIRYSTRAGGMFGTKKQKQGLAMIGLAPKDLRDAQDNVLPLIDLIDKLSKGMAGLPSGKQLDAMEAILGVRGEKAGINLTGLDARGKDIKSLLADIEAGVKKDIAMSQAKAMMDSLQGDFELVKVKWTKFIIAFTSAVEPFLRKVLPLIGKILNGLASFANSGIGKVVFSLAMVITPLIAVMFALRAAAMAAAFALGSTSSSLGFNTILQGGLGALGARGMAARGFGAIATNVAGRHYVRAGQTFTNAAGRTWQAGSMLPRNILSQGSSLVAAGSFGASAATAAGIGGRVLGFITGPWGMGIMAALTVLPLIYGLMSSPNKRSQAKVAEADAEMEGYGKYLSRFDRDRINALNNMGLKAEADKMLNQKIEIYLNGDKLLTHDEQYKHDEGILNQFNLVF